MVGGSTGTDQSDPTDRSEWTRPVRGITTALCRRGWTKPGEGCFPSKFTRPPRAHRAVATPEVIHTGEQWPALQTPPSGVLKTL